MGSGIVQMNKGRGYEITVVRSKKEVEHLRGVWNRLQWHPNADIDFYSIAGKKIMRSTGSAINISAFPKGIYLARVTNTGEKIKLIR